MRDTPRGSWAGLTPGTVDRIDWSFERTCKRYNLQPYVRAVDRFGSLDWEAVLQPSIDKITRYLLLTVTPRQDPSLSYVVNATAIGDDGQRTTSKASHWEYNEAAELERAMDSPDFEDQVSGLIEQMMEWRQSDLTARRLLPSPTRTP